MIEEREIAMIDVCRSPRGRPDPPSLTATTAVPGVPLTARGVGPHARSRGPRVGPQGEARGRPEGMGSWGFRVTHMTPAQEFFLRYSFYQNTRFRGFQSQV